jgi:hypothetical protein
VSRLPAVLEGQPGPPAEHRGPNGVPPVRLRWGETHRLGSARRGDGELEWRLGAAARGGVLTREGVSGNVGEI